MLADWLSKIVCPTYHLSLVHNLAPEWRNVHTTALNVCLQWATCAAQAMETNACLAAVQCEPENAALHVDVQRRYEDTGKVSLNKYCRVGSSWYGMNNQATANTAWA